jgi:flagellar M-ring protein FliF
MPNIDVNQLKRQASKAFAGFTAGQRTMLAIAAVATVVGAFVFLQMSSSGSSYAALYSNLQPADAASVTQQLDSQGVSYQLSGGGGTILVPQDQVYQLRLDMSAKGIPTDGAPGYALLDKAGITTSEFQQRVDYQRAIEGEISKTINAISGVLGSTVHVVVPQQDVFASDDQKPSASVLVKVAPTKALASGQVQSIVHLVASSVEGLQPDQVTVADDQGRMLAAPGVDGATSAAGDARVAQTASYQDQVARSIEDLLAPVTGAGKAKVTVSAQLDFDKTQTTTERFDQGTGTGTLLSENTSSESFTGDGASVGGTLSTGSPTPVSSGTSSDGTYTKSDTQRQYAPGKVTEVVDSAPGAVERLSVAVLVDAAANVGAQEVQDLVTAAAGIDPARGDTVEVQKILFDTTAADAAKQQLDAAAKPGLDITSLARTGGAVVIVALVLLLAWRSAKRDTVARFPLAIPIEGPADTHALAAGDEEAAGAAQGLLSLGSGERRGHDLSPAPIAQLIDHQPSDVAEILRGWLAESR